MSFSKNNQANESLSQYKLLSAYGGAGSLLHTQYGSIIVSCIEEWGFLEIAMDEVVEQDQEPQKNIDKGLAKKGLQRSRDWRLLQDLKSRKRLPNLHSLILIPSIEVNEHSNRIQNDGTPLAISSTFLPKNFIDEQSKALKSYKEWFADWKRAVGRDDLNLFFPPKRALTRKVGDEVSVQRDQKGKPNGTVLKQDNVILICEHGHISSFPWAKYLRWKRENPHVKQEGFADIFGASTCCSKPDISIKDSQGNTAGFDGKFLNCNNKGCGSGVSLKGLFNIKVKCPGHKPWEVETGDNRYYSGNDNARDKEPPTEACDRSMKVVLTTGNNLYFSRSISSIYMPEVLYKRYSEEILDLLREQSQKLFEAGIPSDSIKAIAIKYIGKEKFEDVEAISHPLWEATVRGFQDGLPEGEAGTDQEIDQAERDVQFRHKEFNILTSRSDDDINVDKDRLFVKDVTENLTSDLRGFFRKVLRIDQLMLTTTQLDFSRDRPVDADAGTNVKPQNIFRSFPQDVRVYPAVESFGEGIFFAFDEEQLEQVALDHRFHKMFSRQLDTFGQTSQKHAIDNGNALYIVHTFSHLVMRELEFQCGYPTASLSERLYISANDDTKMYGVLVYTSEGAEGSMGGLIAQTRQENLNVLLKRAFERATICSSDPLCWESEGQGLFELNLASCFSCGLVSETSCEKRNMFLDRRILVDEDLGLFKRVIYQGSETGCIQET
ncbi:DUF1998 domain-containing protein [Pontibacter sp. BT310]|uniref:DUF1998 domain-containing protein n=1 Tax=Pontibacter populi TaxID=890055 RepID=A0ABS6XFG5_9BACT|nr:MULTISPECIES: DUF1998 domain-containing protein [Pontibacter]MBJ6119002.1 DUF1998 domain-containing protein [Pontibacter sp. BT310]MBR0571430.1 DUF1998 domain-containing protein [Microvirga sp. STS03]MBW3365856.1 DUF1998 domain-containing protein [Pontibacter populi]